MERDYRAFLDRVRKDNLEQAALMSVEPVTLTEVQSLLPEGTTLLEYLVGEREVIVWVVDRTRAKALRLPAERAALVAEVRAFRTAIADQAAHPELAYEADERARADLGPLIEQEPRLGEFFRAYRNVVLRERQASEARRLAELQTRAAELRRERSDARD